MPRSNAYLKLNEEMAEAIARETGASKARVLALADALRDPEITLTDFVILVRQEVEGR